MYKLRSCFISLEGIDGTGKSTMISHLAKCLEAKGYKTIITRDPGSTPLGNDLREILLTRVMSPLTEIKLFDTIRQDMIDNIIIPNINSGFVVISDRYIDSTIAYQGFGRGLLKEAIETTQKCKQPDYTILLDIPLEVSLERLKKCLGDDNKDKFDMIDIAFKQRIMEGYKAQAKEHPNRISTIDASGTVEEVQSLLFDWIDSRFT